MEGNPYPEYRQGFDAAMEQRPPINPYRGGTRGNEAWAQGWADGAILHYDKTRGPGWLVRLWRRLWR